MNTTQTMTITERNQKLSDLRVKMDKLKAELEWVKQEMWIVNDQYDRQNLNLFEEMFGTDVTYTGSWLSKPHSISFLNYELHSQRTPTTC